MASPAAFSREIVGHPFKYESHRLGLERSEDAVSWNVFRSFQEAGSLAAIAEQITGDTIGLEPHLYLWGIGTTDDEFRPWPLLVDARKRFESDLPVERPLTEPDISLHLPGRYLIHIEAKFTSRNTYYKQGPRQNASSLTLDELLEIYRDPKLEILDVQKAGSAQRVYQQLWRNTVFAEWMAKVDHPKTRAYHVNLVREGHDEASACEFAGLISPKFQSRFQRVTWEQLYRLAAGGCKLARLRRYLETKTAGLSRAFRIRSGKSC